jgi:hypothetical protein
MSDSVELKNKPMEINFKNKLNPKTKPMQVGK